MATVTVDHRGLILEELNALSSLNFLNGSFDRIEKHLELAKKAGNEGDRMLDHSEHNAAMHERIWHLYALCKALMPDEPDEIRMAYWKMSKFLFHIGKYEDCHNEIEKALKIESTLCGGELMSLKEKCVKRIAEKQIEDIANSDADENPINMILQDKLSLKEQGFSSDVDNAMDLDEETGNDDEKDIDFDKIRYNEKSHLEILADAESKTLFHNVKVRQNKSGKHLVATRDIAPGEIILVSEPYVSVPNFKKVQNYCNHCLMPAWSGIPCKRCSRCMYCSEKCYNESTEKYHDIECACLPYIVSGNYYFDYYVHLSLRAVIKALKEFGSIDKLRNEVNSIRNSSDREVLLEGVEFEKDSFLSLLTYKYTINEPEGLSHFIQPCCKAIISLLKLTSFFGKNCKCDTIEDVMQNEDAVFIGALLLEIVGIAYRNGIQVPDKNSYCKNKMTMNECVAFTPCCERGCSLSTLGALIHHSCNPNVKSIRTRNGKEFWYSLVPIEKDSQLVECYGLSFSEAEYYDRQYSAMESLGEVCSCIACVQKWPAELLRDGRLLSYKQVFKTFSNFIKTADGKKQFLAFINKYGMIRQEIVDLISVHIQQRSKTWMPNFIVCVLNTVLNVIMNELYGHYLDMPIECNNP